MLIIDPEGLFNGDRLRACSDLARLYWPFMYLASNGFGRFEVNYHKFVGSALVGFTDPLTEDEYMGLVQEYADRHLLFLYESDVTGQTWAQWDTNPKLLPRYKTSSDHRSPEPPKQKFEAWLRSYRNSRKRLPKNFGNISGKFPCAVAEAVAVAEVSISKASEAPLRAREEKPPPALEHPEAEERERIASGMLHLVMPHMPNPPDREIVTQVLDALGDRPVRELVDYLQHFRRHRRKAPDSYGFWPMAVKSRFQANGDQS